MTAVDQDIANRRSTIPQALVNAALVLPTVVIWYLRALASDLDWSVDISKLWSLAWTAVLGGYFVRSTTSRRGADVESARPCRHLSCLGAPG